MIRVAAAGRAAAATSPRTPRGTIHGRGVAATRPVGAAADNYYRVFVDVFDELRRRQRAERARVPSALGLVHVV